MQNLILNNYMMFLKSIIEFQKSLFSGINLVAIQAAQFTSKKEDSYDVDWPDDPYLHGYRDKV